MTLRQARLLLCRIGLHRKGSWPCSHVLNRMTDSEWNAWLTSIGLNPVVPSSPSPRPESRSNGQAFLQAASRVVVESGAVSQAEWERALAATTSPSQKDQDTASASAPSGAGR